MKGKGKKEKESNESDDNSCPLQFFDFKPIDLMRQCPRFTSVVQRNEDESIGSEDLDVLQLELETLLVSVVKRQRMLDTEMEALTNWYDSKNRDKRSPNKPSSDITGKRSKHSDEKPNKKFRDNLSNSSGKIQTSRPYKLKNTSVKYTESDYIEPQQKAISKKLPVKNDIPNQFWNFIEPYCCELTADNIKVLTDLLKSYENDSEYHKIPNLGKHYSLKWEHNDLIDQKDKTSNTDKKKGLSASNCASSSSVPQSATKTKRGSKNFTDSDKTSFGALTQRLVSCLIEENLLDSGIIDPKLMDSETNSSKGNNGNNKVFKSLNLGNTAQLERRIRKELEEHGIISLDDILNGSETTSGDEDEILQELKRCQQELKSLSAKNQTQLKRLLSLAKKELSRQEVSKKLQNIDLEVIEAYRRIIAAKQKKRSPNKKEKELAIKALKEREAVLKQLETHS